MILDMARPPVSNLFTAQLAISEVIAKAGDSCDQMKWNPVNHIHTPEVVDIKPLDGSDLLGGMACTGMSGDWHLRPIPGTTLIEKMAQLANRTDLSGGAYMSAKSTGHTFGIILPVEAASNTNRGNPHTRETEVAIVLKKPFRTSSLNTAEASSSQVPGYGPRS